MEAIAAGAEVSKATVYKWWPSKAAVVTEAVMSGYLVVTYEPLPDTGDIQADLRTWLYERFAELEDPTSVALLRAMTAAAAEVTNSERIYEALAMPTRRFLLERLVAASQQGQLRPDASLIAVVDAIVGTLLLRTLSYGQTSPREGADALLDLVLRGVLRPTSDRQRKR